MIELSGRKNDYFGYHLSKWNKSLMSTVSSQIDQNILKRKLKSINIPRSISPQLGLDLWSQTHTNSTNYSEKTPRTQQDGKSLTRLNDERCKTYRKCDICNRCSDDNVCPKHWWNFQLYIKGVHFSINLILSYPVNLFT